MRWILANDLYKGMFLSLKIPNILGIHTHFILIKIELTEEFVFGFSHAGLLTLLGSILTVSSGHTHIIEVLISESSIFQNPQSSCTRFSPLVSLNWILHPRYWIILFVLLIWAFWFFTKTFSTMLDELRRFPCFGKTFIGSCPSALSTDEGFLAFNRFFTSLICFFTHDRGPLVTPYNSKSDLKE